MKNLITLAKKLFKPVAVVKYLFFPFIMAQSQGTVDLSKIVKNETIIAQAETQNTIWIGTNNGLYQINKANGKFAHLTTTNSILPSNNITGICVTKNDNVYAATDNGIFRFDGFSYLLISTENANLPGYVVLCPGRPVRFAELWNSAFLPAEYQGTYINHSNLDPQEMIPLRMSL